MSGEKSNDVKQTVTKYFSPLVTKMLFLFNGLLPTNQDVFCIIYALLQEVCKIIWVAVSANDLVYAIMLAVAIGIKLANWKTTPPEYIPKR